MPRYEFPTVSFDGNATVVVEGPGSEETAREAAAAWLEDHGNGAMLLPDENGS